LQAQTYYGTAQGNGFIANNSVTALPSIVLPATESSAQLLDAMVYLNIFNLNGNEFVLNTPFASGLTRNVTYFSIIQNRTISAFDIYNVSKVYGIKTSSSSARLNLINPMEIIVQFNSTNLSIGNKTEILVVYSGSPFSAVGNLIIENALQSFGNFSVTVTSQSQRINVSSTQVIGPEPIYNLAQMGFFSPLFSLQAYNLSSVFSSTAQKELFQYDQNVASTLNGIYGSFTPFLDIGGRFISVSSMLEPYIFNGMNMTQINTQIKFNSTIGGLFNSAVAFLDAMLCSYARSTQTVCSSAAVVSQEANIESRIV
jgi:hypothetical protein